MLNDCFPTVFCINLDRRPDRFHQAWAQFRKFGMYVRRFAAIDKTDLPENGKISKSELACAMSHLGVIERCRDNGFENVLIFEDDVVLRDDWIDILTSNLPKIEDWDMLYLGGNHVGGLERVDQDIYSLKCTYTTHAYAVNRGMYEKIINRCKEFDKPVDVMISELHSTHKCYAIRDRMGALAWQNPGFSDIQDRVVDYSFIR